MWFLLISGSVLGAFIWRALHRDFKLEQEIMSVITRPMYSLEIQAALLRQHQRRISTQALYVPLDRLVKAGFLKREPRDDGLPYEERSGARRYYYSKTGLIWRKPSIKERFKLALEIA